MSSIKYFPHPVLSKSNDDYSDNFYFKMINGKRHETKEREIIIDDVFYEIKSLSLEKLIKENKALVICEVRCSSTLFSSTHDITKKPTNIVLSQNELRGKVEFNVKVILAKNIDNFIFENDVNKDFYYDAKFNLLKNDILAISNTKKFTFEPRNIKNAIPQGKPIFYCEKNDTIDVPEYEHSERGAILYLPSKPNNNVFREWEKLESKPNLRNMMFIFPLVVRTIVLVDEGRINYDWTEPIKKDIEKYDLSANNYKNIYIAAQKIMNEGKKASYLNALKEVNSN